jgi:hypothetical protein
MYQLLGDPLLRLQYPRDLQFTQTAQDERGTALKLAGTSDVAGDCLIELVRNEPAAARGESTIIASQSRKVPQGPFQIELALPSVVTGPCTLRGFVTGQNAFAAGSTIITLKSAAAPIAAHPSASEISR